MNSLESKKLALIRILEIFKRYSDESHPLTQEEIICRLKNDYGITIERKAVSRNFSLLREAGYEINSSPRGSYLETREFEDSEIKLLIDSVLSSKYITPKQTIGLIDKLSHLSNVYFKSLIKNTCTVNEWNKTDNQEVFYNIDTINEAIGLDKKITFDYNKYGKDKKLHKISKHKVSPYQLILHNQKYYLLAKSDGCDSISYFRLDRITKIKVDNESLYRLSQVKRYERGINYNQLATQPYLDISNDERVEMIVDPSILDEIIDTYGKEVQISDTGSGKYTVFLKSSAASMEHYAMQYVDSIEIVKPQELRERIKESLKNGLRRYDK